MPRGVAAHFVRAEEFLERLRLWAEERQDIRALALVGSFARGDARPDSDLDIVLLTRDPGMFLRDTTWVSTFERAANIVDIEPYGKVTSVRALFDDGLEVEFGIAPADWASEPYDKGTEHVVRGGIAVLMDRDGHVTRLSKGRRDLRSD